jgi:hypothetical protein
MDGGKWPAAEAVAREGAIPLYTFDLSCLAIIVVSVITCSSIISSLFSILPILSGTRCDINHDYIDGASEVGDRNCGGLGKSERLRAGVGDLVIACFQGPSN